MRLRGPPDTLARVTKGASGKTHNDTLVEHGDRLWNAECENATRIAAKIQLLIGGVVAALGFGFFGIQWLFETPSAPVCPPWATLAIHIMLFAVVLNFGLALIALGRRRDEGPHACSKMELQTEDAGQSIKNVVVIRTFDAYFDLKLRNERERLRLREGQEWFAWGVASLLIAILLYLGTSLPTKMYPEASNERYLKFHDAYSGSDRK